MIIELVESIVFVYDINAMDQVGWKATLVAILRLKPRMECSV